MGDTQSRQKGRPPTTQARFPIRLWSVGLFLLLTRMPHFCLKVPTSISVIVFLPLGRGDPILWVMSAPRAKIKSKAPAEWKLIPNEWGAPGPHLSGLPAQDASPRHPWEPCACKQALNCSFAVGQNARCRKSSKPKTGSQYTQSLIVAKLE